MTQIARTSPQGQAHRFLLRGTGGPMFFAADSEDALAGTVARVSSLSPECVGALAALAWRGAEVKLGTVVLRGWAEGDHVDCPHCGASTPVRLVSHPDELAALCHVMSAAWVNEAALAVTSGQPWPHPQQACATCGENVGLPRRG
ncbi:hypothetical protein [Deinococcus pimensis]|uniref:hypothetical protein n=1 Tax=Deinococcus pimensis TaxID=309888 RepID=UPI00048A0E89|nr:hypothetical protein [Deinococcus pimensis]